MSDLKSGNKLDKIGRFLVSPAVIIFLILIFYLVNNISWINRVYYPFPSTGVEGHNIIYADRYAKEIDSQGFSYLLRDYLGYPPVFYVSAAKIWTASKKSISALRLSNLFYLFIILIGIYLLGKEIGGERTGVVAAVLFSLYPAIYGFSRLCVAEFALIAPVVFSILFILKSRGYLDIKSNVLLVIVASIGLLIKAPYVIFILFPALIVLVAHVVQDFLKKDWKCVLLRLGGVLLSCGAVLIMTGWHYLNKNNMQEYTTRVSWPVEKFRLLQVGIGEFLYEWILVLTVPFFTLLIIAAIYYIFNRKKSEIAVMLAWLIVPILFFRLIPRFESLPSPRFFLPVFPAIAIISAYGLCSIKRTYLRYAILSAAIIIGLGQYFIYSYGTIATRNLDGHFIINLMNSRYYCSPDVSDEYSEIHNIVDNGSLKSAVLISYDFGWIALSRSSGFTKKIIVAEMSDMDYVMNGTLNRTIEKNDTIISYVNFHSKEFQKMMQRPTVYKIQNYRLNQKEVEAQNSQIVKSLEKELEKFVLDETILLKNRKRIYIYKRKSG